MIVRIKERKMNRLILAFVLLSGCSTYDKDIVRVWKHCPYEFSQNGYFISDTAFGFQKPMFPKEIDDIQN